MKKWKIGAIEIFGFPQIFDESQEFHQSGQAENPHNSNHPAIVD